MERLVVGLDIGGTKIAAAAVDVQGKVLGRDVMPTDAQRGFADGLERIVCLVKRVLERAKGDRLQAIGIGCAGPVDPAAGTIDNPYTLPTWDGVDIVTPLQSVFGVPVALENDVDAAAMGECWLGAGQGGRVVVMITLGTGVGGGVVIDGQIYRGAGGAHPEIGHLGVDPAGPECYCGIRGCWESLSSGPAMAAAVQAQRPDHPPSSITGESVIRDARAGDPVALAAVHRAAQATARGVFTVVNLYLPDILVLGGGIMAAYDLFAPAVQQVLARDTMAPVDAIQVRQAALGTDAGLLGAARIALARQGNGI